MGDLGDYDLGEGTEPEPPQEPIEPRHRLAPGLVAGLLALAAVAAGTVVWLTGRTHHGTGKLTQPKPPATHTQIPVRAAHDFDPLGDNHVEHPDQVGLAIDNQPDTAWTTETYIGNQLGKAGVGLYLDASPGVAAQTMRIVTTTPGFTVQIYARSSHPPLTWPDPGWKLVGSASRVKKRADIRLSTGGVRYRYYLMWITSLGPVGQVAINELALYT